MENAPNLLIITAEPLFARTLEAHLPLPCRQLKPGTPPDANAAGLLLIPENTREISEMNEICESTGLPALMLLPEGTHRAEPICASLQRPANLAKLCELAARLPEQPRRLNWPGLGSFDPRTMKLTGPDAAEAPLTEKEAALLAYLNGQSAPVSRETLLETIWRYHPETETHTLETHLYRLRQKLKEVFGEQLQITSDDNGYRLIVD